MAIDKRRDLPHFLKNGEINPAQDEALSILMEECGELIQAASKVQRAGLHWVASPEFDLSQRTTRENLVTEAGDVYALFKEMEELGLLSMEEVRKAAKKKRAKLARWTHYLGHDTNANR